MTTATLSPQTEIDVWMRILHPEGALPPEVARAILELSFSSQDMDRLRELSDKARQGTLSSAEDAEMVAAERAGAILSILQSKARQTNLASRRNHSKRVQS